MKTQINVTTPFTFTYPDRTTERFEVGPRSIDEQHADHFFVKAHCGELSDQGAGVNAQLAEATRLIEELTMRLNAVGEELTNANAELDKQDDELEALRAANADLTNANAELAAKLAEAAEAPAKAKKA